MKKHGKAGFWGCEGDVRETLDGEFVMIHDPSTERMTGIDLNVNSTNYSTLETLTINAGNNISLYSNLKIPKLEDYLIICKKFGMVPFIDSLAFNSDDSYSRFIELLDKYDLTDKCVLSSYNGLQALRKIRQITDKPTCILNLPANDWSSASVYFVGVMNELKNAGIGIDQSAFTSNQAEILRSCNSIVSTYVLNDVDSAISELNKGADIIITDYLTSLFKEYKS